MGADGKPVVLSALPPDEQPEVGPAQLARTCAGRKSFPYQRTGGNADRRYVAHLSLLRAGGRRAIRYGVRVGRDGFT